MKLYVCYGTFEVPLRPGGHPCANAHHALTQAGYEPQIVKSHGMGFLPAIFNQTPGRREVRRLTGSSLVPVLALDDGEAIAGARQIVQWAQSHPAAAGAAVAAAAPVAS